MGWIADLLKEIPSAARYKSELEAIESENAMLKAENSRLKSELESLRKEFAVQKQGAGGLNHDAENILAYLAKNEKVTAHQIALGLGLTKGVTDMHLEDLEKSEYIDASFSLDEEPEYYLEQTGRRYLHLRGLL